MHDGASVHRAKSTQKYIVSNRLRMFNGNKWPANSPDMNPIEHVWPLVGHLLVGNVFHDREDLWEALQWAFSKITPAQIKKLYESMPRRIAALRKARGGHTRY